jgi:phosphoglycolate phosphatase
VKLVIFDVDGTLVDSQHMICAAMQRAFGDHDMPCPPRERLLSIVGLSLPDAFERLGEGQAGFPVPTLVERYKEAFFALRAAQAEVEPLYDGAREAITDLVRRDDVMLGIATGKSQRGVRHVLGAHGLIDHFAIIKTADDAPSKPHPGMVLDAMNEAGVAPADTVMIGDSIYDMEMARAAGAHAIGVGWGYHPAEALRRVGAHAVIAEYAALLPALDPLWDGFDRTGRPLRQA